MASRPSDIAIRGGDLIQHVMLADDPLVAQLLVLLVDHDPAMISMVSSLLLPLMDACIHVSINFGGSDIGVNQSR